MGDKYTSILLEIYTLCRTAVHACCILNRQSSANVMYNQGFAVMLYLATSILVCTRIVEIILQF